MKDWDDLRIILALGRAGTMKNAATTLGVSETTIARRLRKVSGDDIASLFIRDGQKWRPTDLGRRLIALGEEVEVQFLDADLAISDVAAGLSGALTISSLSFLNTHFLGREVAAFQACHPDLTVTLSASDDRVSLAYREADVALRLARPTEGRLIGKRLSTVPMVAFSYGGRLPARWVGLPPSLDWTPEMQLGVAAFGGPPQVRIDSFEGVVATAISAAAGGVAPSCFITAQETRPDWMSAPVDRELWITYHEDMRNNPAVRAFIDWISAAFPVADRCLCGACPR